MKLERSGVSWRRGIFSLLGAVTRRENFKKISNIVFPVVFNSCAFLLSLRKRKKERAVIKKRQGLFPVYYFVGCCSAFYVSLNVNRSFLNNISRKIKSDKSSAEET